MIEADQIPIVSFVIPIRHPDNSRDWRSLMRRLDQTMKSISGQTDPRWTAVAVANSGSELPKLPDKFRIVRVDFPPNPRYDLNDGNRSDVYDAVRLDKGRRLLAGMLASSPAQYMMSVDDDDFVSSHIVEFVSRNLSANGWEFVDGYAWSEGSRVICRIPRFAQTCGTSHIVRSDLLRLPPSLAEASDHYVKTMLGSHIKIDDILRGRNTPLAPLPFIGAIYRVGHLEAHSKSRTVLRQHLINKRVLSHPLQFLRNASRMKVATPAIAREFGLTFR